MASQINAIDKKSIHNLCSGQVILDLATAVKELVENSIDAGATSVDVKFKNNGIEGFQVVDNGSGIDPANYESLALKHYTSKLVEFKDLEKVETFGFRGEALSSLCALSGVTVITSTKEQNAMGFKLKFDSNGVLISKAPIARSTGTTIILSNIFHSLPVRQKEFKRNIKREYGNALTILQAYSIISTNVRISVYNQAIKKSSIKVMSTVGNKELKANISNVFGKELASQIIPFKVDLTSAIGSGTVEGYISKPEWGIGRSSSDRQYYFVNGRPCVLPKIAKTLNEVYRLFISKQFPVVIADVKVPTDAYEVNLSPDKRTILIHHETKVTEAIMEQLKSQLEPSRSTFEVNPLLILRSECSAISTEGTEGSVASFTSESSIDDDKIIIDRDRNENSISNESKRSGSTLNGSSSLGSSSLGSSSSKYTLNRRSNIGYTTTKSTTNGNQKSSPSISSFSDIRNFAMLDGNHYKPKNSSGYKRSVTSPLLKHMSKQIKVEHMDEDADQEIDELEDDPSSEIKNKASDLMHLVEKVNFESDEDMTDDSAISVDTPEYIERSMGIKSFSRIINTKNYKRNFPQYSIEALERDAIQRRSTPQKSVSTDPLTLENASFKNTTDDRKAAEALSRVIRKPDFARMEVLGQFNFGFIITSLDEHDLYIVDQHASDEKYNFETLQKTTQFNTQKLIRPQLLDLTAAEELIVMDNLEIFEANGFGVEILDNNEPTKRIQLISHLTSKNTMLDKQDFTELISLINENPGKTVHCSRIRSMFASRACHKATRIGDVLTKKQMKKIVSHMGDIEQPWNCPHGRPTMRHLLSYHRFKQLQPTPQKKPITLKGSLFK